MNRKWWLVILLLLAIPWLLIRANKKPEIGGISGVPELLRKGNEVVPESASAEPNNREAAVNERTRPSLRPEPRVYAKPEPLEYPPAVAVAGKAGYVTSPYNGKLIDVNGIPPGTLVADPTFPMEEMKFFRTPRE